MHSSTIVAASVLMLGVSLAGLAQAGDGNTIYIRQESPLNSAGNSLSIDQSGATESTVAGPSLGAMLPFVGLTLGTALQGEARPALQFGEGNRATITMLDGDAESNRGKLLLLQNSSPGSQSPQFLQGASAGNRADATIVGTSLGAVLQSGTDNLATLVLNDSQGLIGQRGSGLTASLSVETGGTGRIIQIGRNSEAGLEVGAGANVTLNQLGNNMTYFDTAAQTSATAAIQVNSTNAGNITITQIGF